MGRIERQRVVRVGLLDTGIDLLNQVRVRVKTREAIVIGIRRRVVTRFQHAATGFDGKHFSVEVHERSLLNRLHAVQISPINERPPIGVGFTHGEAVKGNASFPEQGGKPVNRVEGILPGSTAVKIGPTAYAPSWSDPNQQLSARSLPFGRSNIAERLQSRQGRGLAR